MNVLVTALILLLALGTRAQAQPEAEWLPEVIDLPGDAELISEREVGSFIRMMTISTGEHGSDLLSGWEEALAASGYQMDRETDPAEEVSVHFSGDGIQNGQIILSPARIEGRWVIEFDVTLR